MEIKVISYKRTNNLGNYSSENMEMTAELSLDDDVDECASNLKNYVETSLGIKKAKIEKAKIEKVGSNYPPF